MKRNLLIISPIALSGMMVASIATSCGGDNTNTTDSTKNDTAVVADTASKMTLAPGMTPWDFPTVGMTSEPGNHVLCPSWGMYTSIFEEEVPADQTLIFYDAVMSAAGEVESDVEFTFDGVQKMPNSMVINIPKGQTAAVGDIVLTWWQTGSGMQRAIVTDASDPKSPKVRYLDLSYDNPATDDESGKSIGATEYKLDPDTFVKITDDWQEGNTIAVKTEWGYEAATIIKVSGDKVLTCGFAGKMKVYSKADCKVVPRVPDVKPGDKVWAITSVSFNEATVVKVDKKLGVVFVKANETEYPVSYGEITKEEMK
ncbi:MAG: hypothetical protein IPM74_09460 [Crocinitomicaceae bacterium]|nr:hypothetical protein [Crocinitomicaceae bacterium]MBK8926120.1 hypothetical protein [Crocinitomicaceae bacterium]